MSACGPVAQPNDSSTNADSSTATDDASSDATTSTCTAMGDTAGPVTDFPMGTWALIRDLAVIIGHDADGLYAYSALCTHERCVIGAPNATGVAVCPCHFSRFDGNGGVIAGLARSPLAHFAMSVCDGIAYVDMSMRVAATTRTPV